ncbi:39S ribosomal protein L40, mitochondrial isoform X1 [Aplysia californica]|uniref:Large ribosomal subunit protein mL40 n=1 Tax=Aplysia californica TaxID=6500 RepID=A0ABM0JMC0_APLCA|nr:39S ribosomal protein L40, mitochondrial isoform X1 [Aplysia californica]
MASTLLSLRNLLKETPVALKVCSYLHTQQTPLLFKASQQLWAEPMKKKKKVDPGVIAAREAKKIKRIEKEIKRLTRFGRILKPVAEIEGVKKSVFDTKERRRGSAVLSFDESEHRALLHKSWARQQTRYWHEEYQLCARLRAAQEEALAELRAESEELYQAAIKIDYSFVPTYFEGPKVTPPLKEHVATDGEYVDTTRKY